VTATRYKPEIAHVAKWQFTKVVDHLDSVENQQMEAKNIRVQDKENKNRTVVQNMRYPACYWDSTYVMAFSETLLRKLAPSCI
jgi:hypothetical protein